MKDRFGLQKALARVKQTDVKLPDLDKVARAADDVEGLMDDLETSVRRMATQMKRGEEPKVDDYIANRKTLIALSAKLDRDVSQLEKSIVEQEKAFKAAKDTKALKALSDVEKALEELGDALAENKRLPHANEIMLAMAGRDFKAPKKSEKKDGPIKHAVKIDDKTPGSSFMGEVEWAKKAVPDLDLKSLTKLDKEIRGLDAVATAAIRFDRDLEIVSVFIRQPSPKLEQKASATAEELTKLVQTAAEAKDDLSKIETAIKKLRPGSDREKEAGQALDKSFQLTRRIVETAWKQVAQYADKNNTPSRRFADALAQAKAKAQAKKDASNPKSPSGR